MLKLRKFYNKPLPKNFKLISGNLYNIVKNFKVVIASGSSSSVYESLLSGSKIIFPINDYYDNLNLEMLDVPKSYYKVCNNITELDTHISKILSQDIKYFEYYKNKLKNSINDKRNTKFFGKS